jgi:serine protease Do
MIPFCSHRPLAGRTRLLLPPLIGASLALASPPARADEAVCGQTAAQIFANTRLQIVEIFSMVINQYRVSGRVEPRIGTGLRLAGGGIVTNYHVIADAKYSVIYDDTGRWDAEVIGSDPSLDIAVLKMDSLFDQPAGLDFAAPDALTIGQKVFPIGFPRGLGMVTRVASPSQAENMGFAIPAAMLKPVVDEILATGHVARPWHGLFGQMVTPPILSMPGVPFDEWDATSGFLVETVEPGSAADRVDIKGGEWPINWGGTSVLLGGDIITSVNGTPIDSLTTALDVVRGLKVGQTISVV